MSIVILILCVVFAALLFWATHWLSGEYSKVRSELDSFREAAKQCKDQQSLWLLRKRVACYADKRCWHKDLMARSREVLAYIDGCIGPSGPRIEPWK